MPKLGSKPCSFYLSGRYGRRESFDVSKYGWKEAVKAARASSKRESYTGTVGMTCGREGDFLPLLECRAGTCTAYAPDDHMASQRALAGAGKKRKRKKAKRAKDKVGNYAKPKRLRRKRNAKGRGIGGCVTTRAGSKLCAGKRRR